MHRLIDLMPMSITGMIMGISSCLNQSSLIVHSGANPGHPYLGPNGSSKGIFIGILLPSWHSFDSPTWERQLLQPNLRHTSRALRSIDFFAIALLIPGYMCMPSEPRATNSCGGGRKQLWSKHCWFCTLEISTAMTPRWAVQDWWLSSVTIQQFFSPLSAPFTRKPCGVFSMLTLI